MGTSQAHNGRNRGAWTSRPEEAVHLLRLLPQPPSERGHPLVLYLEPGLVWLGPLPQYPSLLGSSSSPKQRSTHWKPTHQHLHGHHNHLCHHLCLDGSHSGSIGALLMLFLNGWTWQLVSAGNPVNGFPLWQPVLAFHLFMWIVQFIGHGVFE